MRLLCVHAHFDDFELSAGGLFLTCCQRGGAEVEPKVIICTDGEAGHHRRSRHETGRMRVREQAASAEIGDYAFELLRYPSGQVPREGCLQASPACLAGLWRAIRAFEPDYLFCPPIPSDPRVGIHVDHIAVAEAIRNVAYMINVPHAFSPEFPDMEEGRAEPCKVPTILTVYDGYSMGEGGYDLAVDVEEVFPTVSRMAYCHQSQIAEWLPWVGRHEMEVPTDFEHWQAMLRARMCKRQRQLGIAIDRVMEVFTVTAWGRVPTVEELKRDIPGIRTEESHLDALTARLKQWRGY